MSTTILTAQGSLFEASEGLPDGLAYRAAFIDRSEERALIEVIAKLPLHEARYKDFTARRRVVAFGSTFDCLEPQPIGVLPDPLQALRERLAAWTGVAADDFAHVMVAEYGPGTPLGWHRDAPDYELIAGVSLGSAARLRFRPWPPRDPKKHDSWRSSWRRVRPTAWRRLRAGAGSTACRRCRRCATR